MRQCPDKPELERLRQVTDLELAGGCTEWQENQQLSVFSPRQKLKSADCLAFDPVAVNASLNSWRFPWKGQHSIRTIANAQSYKPRLCAVIINYATAFHPD